jgi:DNA-binding GntR family transcriptional regulator
MPQIVRLTLVDEIRTMLREEILSGRLHPGQRLREQQVAQDMGTSPGPVREAFASLSQEGLLISLPHRGTFVATVSEAEAQMAYDLRSLIEPFAVSLALPRVDGQLLDLLRSDIEQMQRAAALPDLGSLIAADMRFHGRLYELAGTEVMANVWGSVSATIRQFIAVAAPPYYPDLRDAADDHVVLLDLVRNGDLDGLRVEIPNHVSNLWRRIKAAREREDASGGSTDGEEG